MSTDRKATSASPLRLTSIRHENTCLEMCYNPVKRKTNYVGLDDKGVVQTTSKASVDGRTYIPYHPHHPFVEHGVVRFPEKAETYGDITSLKQEIQEYIHRYVDISPIFETIAVHYILLTWLYDLHRSLGYLRIMGDLGSGKTRFLTVVGNICYKPLFASGAATVAPLFHLINEVNGTLIMDESDFYRSSEQSLIAKILNNGNAVGFPVLRCERKADQSFVTKAYSVFGPKVMASRGRFDDQALESRFLTESSGLRPLRDDIPLELDTTFDQEALNLRNKLLMFRLVHMRSGLPDAQIRKHDLSPRMGQIIYPLRV